MRFHPTFEVEKEQRMVFMAPPQPAAAPGEGAAGAPPAAETLTEKQKEIQDKIDTINADPEAAKDLADFQVKQAGEAEEALQARFEKAVLDAAKTYHEELTRMADPNALEKVNTAFKPAQVSFELQGGNLVMRKEAGEEEGEEEAEAPKLSPEDEQLVQDVVSLFPGNLKETAEKVATELITDPKTREGASKFRDAIVPLSPKAREAVIRETSAGLNRQKLPTPAPGIQKEFDAAKDAMGPEGQAFAKKLIERVQGALTEEGNKLSDEEREDIIEGAEKELEKFDATKASEIDKNIMLARMQMRGIDTSNPDGIFKKPPELKVFEGSPMERGFNQIMGLIGFILLSIQKLKDAMKPKEKSADVPAGGKAGPEALSPEKDAARQRVKEQMKTTAGDALLTQKQAARTNAQNEIKKIEGDLGELKDKEDEESKVARTALTDSLKQKQQEEAALGQEVTVLQDMKTTAETQRNVLNAGRDALVDYLGRPDARFRVPNCDAMRDNLKKISFTVNGKFELTVTNETGGPVDRTVLGALTGLLSFRGGSAVDSFAIDDQGVLKQPDSLLALFRQQLDSFRADVKADEPPRPTAAPAQAGGAAAAPAA